MTYRAFFLFSITVITPGDLHAVDQKAPVAFPAAGDEERVHAAGRHFVDAVVFALIELGGVAWHPVDVLRDFHSCPRWKAYIKQPLFRVPTTQDERARIPRMVVQVSVSVGPHDVVNSNRPRRPLEPTFARLVVVWVEQPPAAHVQLSAIS